MKAPVAYSRYDWLLQVLIIPLHIGLLNWAFIGNAYWQRWQTFVLASAISLFISYFAWLVNNSIGLRLQQRYPRPDQYQIRTRLLALSCAPSSSFHSTAIFGLYTIIGIPGFVPDPVRLGLGILSTIIIVIIVIATYESIHNYEKWQQSRLENVTLSQTQLQAQLDALRQQVNPHFLFNSLNSLISLIEDDPAKAGIFAEELSTVYRHLLRSNEQSLNTLSSELDFLRAYSHLLKTRYGDAFTLTTNVHPGAESAQLPPLTLQLLIENAVKHNVILPDQPLHVCLTATEAHLEVSNPIRRKPGRVLSNGVGLSNIVSKYQVLGQSAPIIEDDGKIFKVTLPLLRAS